MFFFTNCFQWQAHIQISTIVPRIKTHPVFCGFGELCYIEEMTPITSGHVFLCCFSLDNINYMSLTSLKYLEGPL